MALGRGSRAWPVTVAVVASSFLSGCSAELPPVPPTTPAARPEHRVHVTPPDIADGDFPSPLSVDTAETILGQTLFFDLADPQTRRPGRQIQAFNVLADQPDSRERFARLAREARPAGRLYGLCGLLLLARDAAVSTARTLSLLEADVAIREDDFTFDTSMSRAIVLILLYDVANRFRAQRAVVDAFYRARASSHR